MKTNLRFLAVAAAILSVLSCTREIESIDKEETPQSLHYVHFVADAPERTIVSISPSRTGFDFFVNVSATLQSSAESSFALCQ